MGTAVVVIVVILAVALLGLLLAVRVVKQYEDGVLFRLRSSHRERQAGVSG